MNSFNLNGFLQNYTLPTIIIALIVAICYIVITVIFADKLSSPVKNFIPFICSMLLYYVYDLIFTSAQFPPSKSTLSCGMVAGSLSTMIFALFKRFKKGKPLIADTMILVIEGIICDYVSDSALNIASLAIKELFVRDSASENSPTKECRKEDYDNQKLIGEIAQIIKDNSDKQFTDVELRAVASLTVEAVVNLKKS